MLDNRYKITKVLGVGGMAVVFEAFDTKFNRIVAVKMLKDEIANNSQSVKRFINESKAVSLLSHPNIVSIYDVSVKDNLKYIVMERVDGITLKSYMTQKGALPFEEMMNYTEQILRALEHAHSKGIIHRDIKPQNILLLKNGRIKVTDFGIAKLPDADTVTMTDKAIGTVYYISPEQASGIPIDQRSDLYSLGVLMYEMATGELPFDADSPVSVALMQVNETATPPREINPAVPMGLEQIINLAMEKKPDRRFQNATQMLRHVLQLKNNPALIFKTRPQDVKRKSQSSETVTKSKKKTDSMPRRGGRSMFPVVLGVTTAFLLVVAVCVGMIVVRFRDVTQAPINTNTIAIPDLMGQELNSEMKEQLTQQGFKITLSYDDSDPGIYPNTVVAQTPSAGEIRNIVPGQQSCDLHLTLSRGSNSVALPDVTLKNYQDVENALTELGLTYKEVFEVNSTIPGDSVIRTMPLAGTQVNIGDEITIYISKGASAEATVTVPNFIGLTVDQAKAQLEKYGLSIGEIRKKSSDSIKDTIISQSVNANEKVPAKTKIDFEVSNG